MHRRSLAPLALTAGLVFCLVPRSHAQPTAATAPATEAVPAAGAIAGTVATADGAPIAGAEVRVSGTTRVARTDASGAFRLDRLPPGGYLLEVLSDRHGGNAVEVAVAAGAVATVAVVLDLAVHDEEIVVTASPQAAALSDLAQPVGVLAGEDLAAAARPSLGETLATQPGVSATSFGAGASRPVIRGQGGNRVRILENGVGSGDASDTSPDHAVAIDPTSADRIEVVRGPATLLYGSNAIGGVVNVLDDRIPDHLAGVPLTGSAQLVAASNAGEATGGFELGGSRERIAWNASGFRRDTGDYSSGDGPGRGSDEVANSDLESDGGSLGLSWVTDDGYVGVAARRFDSVYGNPAEEDVRIDLAQRRYDLHAGLDRAFGVFEGARLRLGVNDYEHVELAAGEVGTRFLDDSWELRLDGTHRALGPFRGTVGVQVSSRDFAAVGEEAFVPPTSAESWAVFAFEETGGGPLRGQVGFRHERQSSSAVGRPGRDFAATSASVGGLWEALDTLSVALTVARAVKIPDPEQLYADGPHVATGVFEIGDPDLDVETTTGVDLSLRHHAGRVRTELSLFANRIDDYIFDSFTGEVAGGEGEPHDGEEGEHDHGPLPVVRFVQADAEFRGGELQTHVELLHADPHHLELDLGGDLVRAELRASGEPLPRITPARFFAGLHYQGEQLSGSLFVRRTQSQDRVAAFETATAGFTQLDASAGYRFFRGDTMHELLLAGTNLTDELARNHVSYLKDVAPLPGRDLRLTYRVTF